MTTAVDANIILDILVGEDTEMDLAAQALRRAELDGHLIISVICYGEIAGNFPSQARADDFFKLIGCSIEGIDRETAFLAGVFFREYRKRGGERTRILPDFLIAAHAQLKADRLLTRDKRFYGSAFSKLKTISPASQTTPRSSK